ncbi:MAG: hypothetical protein ACR2IK_05780 [Chloroflexota bacterium]
MIAEPDSPITAPPGPPASADSIEVTPLSPAELYQLTLYKWRYSLESYGFETGAVRELMFLKWLYTSHHVPS